MPFGGVQVGVQGKEGEGSFKVNIYYAKGLTPVEYPNMEINKYGRL